MNNFESQNTSEELKRQNNNNYYNVGSNIIR